MLAWSEGIDNGRQKTRNHGYDVIVAESYLLITRSPRQTVTLNPKSTNRRRTLLSFPVGGMPTVLLGLKRLLSEK